MMIRRIVNFMPYQGLSLSQKNSILSFISEYLQQGDLVTGDLPAGDVVAAMSPERCNTGCWGFPHDVLYIVDFVDRRF